MFNGSKASGVCISSKMCIYINGEEIHPEIEKKKREGFIAINAGINLNAGDILAVEKYHLWILLTAQV